MATTLDSRPSAITLDLEELVRMAWDGRIRVPHFQRDFRWGWEDVRRLFDSIVKGYPIGSLLLWTRSAPAGRIQLGALTIDAPKISEAYWVVDGQQRLTSLANALHFGGEIPARFALSYDLTANEFVRTPPIEDPLVIPLPVLFNLQEILKWFARNPGIAEYLDVATGITRTIRQFEVPAYLVSQDDPHVLQDIFDRMNNYGKRLSRAEVFAALNAGDEEDTGGSLTFERIAEHISVDFKFGVIDNDSVLGAILARRGAEIRRDIRTEFAKPNDEGRDAAFEAGERALRLVVGFLQNDVGVPHISMLAYRYLLVVLSRFFAFHPEPSQRNRRLLRRWYWQAAVVGPERFKGSTPNAARVLCTQVVPESQSASVQGLLRSIHSEHPRPLDVTRFSTNEAATKMLLSVWWSLQPRDPATAEPYEQQDLADALLDQQTARDAVSYVVPRSSVPIEYRPWAAIRALMPGIDVDAREIPALIADKPVGLEKRKWLEVLQSHNLTEKDAGLLSSGDYARFIKERRALIEQNVREFLERMCEWKFENTPPLAGLVIGDDDTDD